MQVEKEIAILMADLTGYTAMTDVHGGASAARMVTKYMEIVAASCSGTARMTQRVGDQVVIIADLAVDIMETVSTIHSLTQEEHHFLAIHAGVHFGPVFMENENLFGSTINVTSRIMNLASRGQILCSGVFLSKVPETDRENFIHRGTHRFRNVLDEVEIFELALSSPYTLHLDPVCHMHLDPEKPFNSYSYNGAIYYFCSTRCLELFQATPERFLTRIPEP